MKVRWTGRARTRLAEIHDYIAQQSSKSRALATIERLLERSEQLMNAPRSGSRLPGFVEEEVREILERPYRIIYRISADGVDVLTVKHYRQRIIERPEDF